MQTPIIVRFDVRDPRRNLPPVTGRKRRESNFVASFERAFTTNQGPRGIGGRQFAVAGFGIADFIWLAPEARQTRKLSRPWKPDDVRRYFFQTQLVAFEMKLKDWKKALQQAYRYTFFADQSIVVLPSEIIERALSSRALFERLEVGLWSFDVKTNQIVKFLTPENAGARSTALREKATELILRKVDLRKFAK